MLGARGAGHLAKHQLLRHAPRQADTHHVQRVLPRGGFEAGEAVVPALERGDVDLHLLRGVAEQHAVGQTVTGLVHRQQRAKVRIGPLLEPVQLQRDRKRSLRRAFWPLAPHQQMPLVGCQVDGELLRQWKLLLHHPQRGVDQVGAQDGVHR
ncbi:hypothetical protein D3C86_1786780 [compost metagenome]